MNSYYYVVDSMLFYIFCVIFSCDGGKKMQTKEISNFCNKLLYVWNIIDNELILDKNIY